ncbi:copper transporter [Actinotalea ferrariae]|uniref:copper transporter n=1 Tax=Actinotalea ferrariae TaxID=1386098 RepID=UPI001C8BB9A4|nr:copper transporter [Actinotalea ferrariae]MBX9245292.1 copper transporter [Actinotalea ferrariae]
MIDFRYHLVSLISVFLALAVGIALGAGPLKETIGDTLTGQVEQLRAEKEDLRAQLDETSTDLAQSEAAFAASAPDLLDGVLAGRRVAVVQVGEVLPEARDQVVERLGQAGATVSATVQVTELWDDPEQRSFRQGIAGSLVQWLDPVPAEDAGTGTELAEALIQSLVTAEPTDPDVVGANAVTVMDLLVESGLVTVGDGGVSTPADAVVVLAGPTVSAAEVQEAAEATPEEQEPEAQELADARLTSAAQIARAAQDRSNGAVVGGGEVTDGTLVQRVRQDEAASGRLSTVESVHTLVGQVSVPLALSARIGGTVGHYGTTEGATAPVPARVVLPPVQRITVPVVEDPAGTEPGTEQG